MNKSTLRSSLAVLVASLALAGCVSQQAAPTWVADVNAAAQRYWNRQVVIEGQVTKVEADPEGTSRGRYILVDDSDNSGIVVVSKELPAPGEILRVDGQIVQDPRNAVRPMLREIQRGTPNNSRWRWAVVASAALAVVLIGVLVWLLLKPEAEVREARRAEAPSARDDRADDLKREHRAPPDDLTKDFQFWGVELAIVEGPDSGKAFAIGASPTHIGRNGRNGTNGRRNEIELSDTTISREQATLTRNRHSGAFSLKNDSKRNPTVVNGREVDSTELEPGAKIRFGATVAEFRQVN